MEEKERLEKLEPAEDPADQGEKKEAMEAGSGRKDRREAGLNVDGELSVEAVRRWLLWAGLALGICLAASCILGTVFLMQNRKPAVLLTVDGKDSRELVLNRKGGVIRKNGNPDSMAGLSLRECCERLLEELHGAQMLGDQEAALFTVRPIEGAVRVDTERMAEEIAVAAELFLTTRQAKGTVYAGSISEEPEVLELVRENGCSVGKAAMVQDLLERNVRVRESDCGRLCQMDMGALCREMGQENYQTSFLTVKAGKLYQVKEDQTGGTEPVEQTLGETGTETDGSSGTEENGTDPGKDGVHGASGNHGSGNSGGGERPAETVTEPEGKESRPEEEGRESQGEDASSAEPENDDTSEAEEESENREPSEPDPESEKPEAAAPPETSSAAPEPTAEPAADAVPETSAPAAETAAPEPSTAAPGMLTPVSPTPEETPAPETEPPRPPETPPATEPHTVGPGILEDVVPAG